MQLFGCTTIRESCLYLASTSVSFGEVAGDLPSVTFLLGKAVGHLSPASVLSGEVGDLRTVFHLSGRVVDNFYIYQSHLIVSVAFSARNVDSF